jgi:hypothetical protein
MNVVNDRRQSLLTVVVNVWGCISLVLQRVEWGIEDEVRWRVFWLLWSGGTLWVSFSMDECSRWVFGAIRFHWRLRKEEAILQWMRRKMWKIILVCSCSQFGQWRPAKPSWVLWGPELSKLLSQGDYPEFDARFLTYVMLNPSCNSLKLSLQFNYSPCVEYPKVIYGASQP